MKYLKAIGIIIFLVGWGSCQPPVVFGEPQPVGTEPLTEIPEDYKGVYWCNVDSATLFVDKSTLVKRKEFILKLTEADIQDSPELMLKDDKLHIVDWEASFPVQRIGDTITSSVIFRDTIFSIGKDQVAKRFKGHLILNSKLAADGWAVLVVTNRSTNVLSMARADLPEDLTELGNITPIKPLSKKDGKETRIFIAPTKDEFEAILKKGILFQTSCTEFERIIPINPFVY